MLRNTKRVLWTLIWLCVASALWALDVEVTYERNVRRGVPADFRSLHQPKVVNWRT